MIPRQVDFEQFHTAPENQTRSEKMDGPDETMFQRALSRAGRLKTSLRNPDSFKLADYGVLVMPNDAICFTYRAQNGFGGLNVEHAVMTPKGVFKANDSHLWNSTCVGVGSGKDDTEMVKAYLN